MGGRLLRRWLSQPLLDVAAINQRLDVVQSFFDSTTVRIEVRETLKELGDLERWTNRVIQVALPRSGGHFADVLKRVPEMKGRKGTGEQGSREKFQCSPCHPVTLSAILSTSCLPAATFCHSSTPRRRPTRRAFQSGGDSRRL